MISFVLNNKVTEIHQAKADLTLLEYLREQQKLTGTKEGCASGDCGACTVVIAEVTGSDENQLQYSAINSCVTFLSALQGKQLITVEHLSDGQDLHPVQQSMVEHHGSQCGFCTPGFIMSMFALYQQPKIADKETVIHALSGNLCRCTGYRPIIDAAIHACQNKQPDKFQNNQSQTVSLLKSIQPPQTGTANLLIPSSRSELAITIADYPNAKVFAGATDLALEVTQQLKSHEHLIALGSVPELNQLQAGESGLKIGAALSFNKIEASLLKYFPDLSELLTRFAATPIRNQASLGGNVANASPIGDMPPALLALNAVIHLDDGKNKRMVPASEFFLDYKQTARRADEWVEAIFIPYSQDKSFVRAYKISKRYEDDISAVCAVFNATLEQGNITTIHCGFGGVAAIPATVDALNNALKGRSWSNAETYEVGKALLSTAFSPIDDVRASKEYRVTMVVNLWKRFWLETNQQSQQIETRVVHIPESTTPQNDGVTHA